MHTDTQEISQAEAIEIPGGNWFTQLAAQLVDTLYDLSDDFEANGSNRPYQQYE
jgi:hypothetical protein